MVALLLAMGPVAWGQTSFGLLDDSTDPLLGEEGEGEDGLLDDITDPLLGEGEGEGGLLDDVLDTLPIPIVGLDDFEPDNTPEQARWAGLVDRSLLNGISLLNVLRTHNFHADGDEDWVKFFALSGQEVTIETRDLLSGSDTFVSVFRVGANDDPVGTPPSECLEDAVPGPNGTTLLPVGCNDNTVGSVDARRSVVEFLAPRTGFYYARIQFSPNASSDKGGGGASGPETTYNYVGSSQGLIASSLYCTVTEAEDGDPITDALVHLDPHDVYQDYNAGGVYPIDGIPADTYTVTVTAPGRALKQAVVSVQSGEQKEIVVSLEPDGGATEGEPPLTHSADYEAPHGALSLAELLRVVQLYNARRHHCDDATEDGFAPYPGNEFCTPHVGDYEPLDWTISLTELLRMVQFYNVGGFVACEESEDGFCPSG